MKFRTKEQYKKEKEEGNSMVQFFSPRSRGLRVVVTPQQWVLKETPKGSVTMPIPGKSAEFEDHYFATDDQEIIDYLTNVYDHKRYPIVRTDTKTASASG